VLDAAKSMRLEEAIAIGVDAQQGTRRTMEDTHVCLPNARTLEGYRGPPACYLAVYDGHGGVKSATHVEEHLHKSLLLSAEWAAGDHDLALRKAFERVDGELVKRAAAEKFKDGTTVVVVVLLGNELISANVGDSEAVLGRRRVAGDPAAKTGPVRPGYAPVLLSEKHLPTVKSEKERIETIGGYVVQGRLFGRLAVSRALGDAELKRPQQEQNYVSSEPQIMRVKLQPGDDFVIIACDGLWGKFTAEEACNFVATWRAKGEPASVIAKKLVDDALLRGSMDNCTVILALLDWTPVA